MELYYAEQHSSAFSAGEGAEEQQERDNDNDNDSDDDNYHHSPSLVYVCVSYTIHHYYSTLIVFSHRRE